MKVAIITAMPEEFRAVAGSLEFHDRVPLNGLRCGRSRLGGNDILVTESGMGFDNAARAVEMVISGYRPDLLVSAGFCGGLDPGLRVGDLVVSKELVIVSKGGIEQVPVTLTDAGKTFVALQSAQGVRIFGGVFASTPVLHPKAELAEMLPEHAPFPVVEMESSAIAIIAAGYGIPLLAIRAVSDPFDEELGFTLDEFCDSRMRISPRKVLLTLLRRPRLIPQLIRLARNARIAEKSLADAMQTLLPAL